jgi:hypothetical protein
LLTGSFNTDPDDFAQLPQPGDQRVLTCRRRRELLVAENLAVPSQ